MNYNCCSYIKNNNVVEANLESNIILYDSETEKTFYFNELGTLVWNGIDVYEDYSQLEKAVLKEISALNPDTCCVVRDIKNFIEDLIAIELLKSE